MQCDIRPNPRQLFGNVIELNSIHVRASTRAFRDERTRTMDRMMDSMTLQGTDYENRKRNKHIISSFSLPKKIEALEAKVNASMNAPNARHSDN